jgi:hypothetical protein
MSKILNKLLIITLLFLVPACTQKNEGNDNKLTKKTYEPNLDKRLDQNTGILFGDIGGKKSGTFDFASSNVLWRATLEVFNNIPLSNVDYAGGVIISDWYSNNSSNDSIKIVVNFASDELKPSSVNIKSFKKKCDNQSKCSTIKMSDKFNQEIKDKIINSARELSIAKETKK